MAHKTYNWNSLQKEYDDGLSIRELKKKYGVSCSGVRLAINRGDFIPRTRKQAAENKSLNILKKNLSQEQINLVLSGKLNYCCMCKSTKPTSNFNQNKECQNGLQKYCRECANNRNQQRKLKIVSENKIKIINYLELHPCVDCGEKDILCLDFDHQRDKVKQIGTMTDMAYPWEKIQKEIEKCKVRCANCHRRKTHKERNTFKFQYKQEIKNE